MMICCLCDGPIGEAATLSKEVRGFLNARGKAMTWAETGRVAHYACAENVAEGGTPWREQRLIDIKDWGLTPEEESHG